MSNSRRKKWLDYPPEQCEVLTSFPNTIFNNTQKSEDNYSLVSLHPVCLGCYSLYVQICKEVADVFNLSLDAKKQEWPIEQLFHEIKMITDRSGDDDSVWSKDNILDHLKDTEHKLQVIGRCIRARVYHHKNCAKRNSEFRINRKPVHLGNLFGDMKHDTFIIQLCYHIDLLYKYYLALIYHHNYIFQTGKDKRPPYVNRIDKDLQDVFNHCDRKFLTIDVDDSNILNKEYLTEERDKYIIQKTKENKSSTKKSRQKPKSSYKAIKQVRVVKYKTYGLEREA